MLDRAIFALDLRRRRAREGPLEGPGGVILPIYGGPDLFRGRKIPGAPDREHEICLDSIENPAAITRPSADNATTAYRR